MIIEGMAPVGGVVGVLLHNDKSFSMCFFLMPFLSRWWGRDPDRLRF